jgi:hypothetical protein
LLAPLTINCTAQPLNPSNPSRMTSNKPTDPLESRIYTLLLPHHSVPIQDRKIDHDSFSLFLNLAFLIRHYRTGVARENRASLEDVSLASHGAMTGPGSSLVTQVGVFAHVSNGTWTVVRFEVREGGDWIQALSLAVHEAVETAFEEIGNGEGDGDGE